MSLDFARMARSMMPQPAPTVTATPDDAVEAAERAILKKQLEAKVPQRLTSRERAEARYRAKYQSPWATMRARTPAPDLAAPFAGGSGTPAKLEGATPGQQRTLGQGGFGARLLGAAAKAARDGDWGTLAHPVTLVDRALNQASVEQQAFIEKNSQSDWEGLGSADPAWLARDKQRAIAWATANMATIERYLFTHYRWCEAYNSWVPMANAAHRSMAELAEAAMLMGFKGSSERDMAKFVLGLEVSLDQALALVNARVLGPANKQSWSTRGDDTKAHAEARPVLEGEAITGKLTHAKEMYQALLLAHMGVYEGLLEDKRQVLKGDRARTAGAIAEINETIQFWAGLGGFVDTAIGHAAPLATGETAAKIDGALVNEGRAHGRDALDQAGEAVAHPGDRGARVDVRMHVADYEEHHDTWGPGGAKAAAEAGVEAQAHAPSISIPDLSIAGLFEFGARVANQKNVNLLQQKLAGINANLSASKVALGMAQSQQRLTKFQRARETYQTATGALQAGGTAARGQAVVELGYQLDAYAVEHGGELRAHGGAALVPGPGKELFATAMACMAKVAQFRAMSRLALGAFPFDQLSDAAAQMNAERSGKAPIQESAGMSAHRQPPRVPGMTADETQMYQQMAGTYLRVAELDASWGLRLDGVEQRFRTLMVKATGINAAGAIGKEY